MPTTRLQFAEEMNRLRSRVLEMGNAVDRMVGEAFRALAEHSAATAEEVIGADDGIDAMDLEIESQCMRLLALQQPMARDLRLIGTALKVITDLERIGDHSVDVAKVARKLAAEPLDVPLFELPQMAGSARQMLEDALLAFVNHDLSLVEKVVAADDEIDKLYHEVRSEFHQIMRDKPELVVQTSYLLFVAHYFERIADHAVNIAERVYFIETGKLAQLSKGHAAASQP